MVERPPVLGQLLVSLSLLFLCWATLNLMGSKAAFSSYRKQGNCHVLALQRQQCDFWVCVCVFLPQSFIADRLTAVVNLSCRAKHLLFHLWTDPGAVSWVQNSPRAKGGRGGQEDCGCHGLLEAKLVCVWMCLLWRGAGTLHSHSVLLTALPVMLCQLSRLCLYVHSLTSLSWEKKVKCVKKVDGGSKTWMVRS